MAQQYLLPCACGEANVVSTTQAGGTVTCKCGQPSRIPSLAGLRQLAPLKSDETSVTRGRPWSGRRAIAILVAVAVVGAAAFVFGLVSWNGHHLGLADDFFQRRAFDEAELHLKQVVPVGWGNRDASLLAVRTARRQGRIEEAGKRLERCQRQFRGDPEFALEERLLTMQQGNMEGADELIGFHASHPELPAAPWVLEAYIVGNLQILMPAYAHNLTFAGSEYQLPIKRTQESIEKWLTLRTNHEDQVQGFIWSFQAHLFDHSLEAARADIYHALELAPKHREARIMLAIFLSQEYPADAVDIWQQLHDEYPDDLDTTLNLADLRRRLGQLSEADSLFAKVLAREPNHVAALLNRGLIAMDLQDLAGAEALLRTAYQADSRSAQVNLALSRCLRASGEFDEAKVFQAKFDQIKAKEKKQRDAAMSPASFQ
jgi:tetratricopeptide (TPR) repeat protein